MENKQKDFLREAKKNKKDEFYTQLIDIERELQYYENQFKGQTVLCNCDDATKSNFYKYFVDNFEKLGLKKLISVCYKTHKDENGYYYEYSGSEKEKRYPNKEDMTKLAGDGDFRSKESIAFLEEADVVVTNPPFSLFREYVAQLVEYDKKYLIIGNVNAITYKNIFELLKHDKAWLGVNLGRGISGFVVPNHYELYGTETQVDKNENQIISPNNCLWLTNLDNYRKHEELVLTKQYNGNEDLYEQYDNYDGINVNKTKDIPCDYKGAMGVPITFMHKFNPDQFEIIKFRKGNDEKDLRINGKCPYFRILVRNKKAV